MALLQVEVLSVERVALSEEATLVRVPTLLGEISILPNHEPLVSILAAGTIEVRTKEGTVRLACGGGFIEVAHNKVAILSDHITPATPVTA